ncbi:MAG: hypothetical protein F6J89_31400 [Symploca sp. SIO1C4]|uniref:Uncharacterized protein n=1 Tax=Symploca sp. SIO1C4 TaxID=2607765 RepID=A0A6B3NJN0_9CYAN|nr:hypothetical protein [Symploca sp. SIO1C4]
MASPLLEHSGQVYSSGAIKLCSIALRARLQGRRLQGRRGEFDKVLAI